MSLFLRAVPGLKNHVVFECKIVPCLGRDIFCRYRVALAEFVIHFGNAAEDVF